MTTTVPPGLQRSTRRCANGSGSVTFSIAARSRRHRRVRYRCGQQVAGDELDPVDGGRRAEVDSDQPRVRAARMEESQKITVAPTDVYDGSGARGRVCRPHPEQRPDLGARTSSCGLSRSSSGRSARRREPCRVAPKRGGCFITIKVRRNRGGDEAGRLGAERAGRGGSLFPAIWSRPAPARAGPSPSKITGLPGAGAGGGHMVAVAQVVRASGCGPEGRGFESPQSPLISGTHVIRSVRKAQRSVE